LDVEEDNVNRGVLVVLVSLAAVLTLAACPTIVKGSAQQVSIRSNPDDATVKVYDSSGNVVYDGKTPATAILKKGAAFFRPASYRVVVERTGYKVKEISLVGGIEGWYLGNLIFGGLIGMLIVDPSTGAMWTLTPAQVDVELEKGTAYVPSSGTLIVTLRENVSGEVASLMKPLTIAN